MEKRDWSSESYSTESLVEMNRLNNLSDGVFAIALTLLAFDIRVADGVAIGDLPNKLLELAPTLIVFLISFVVIGGAWSSHQRMLYQIKRGDGLLVWFNLVCLLFVVLLPASAALLGRFPNAFLAILCFALDVALIQLASQWLWRHASRHGLVNPTLDALVVKSVGRRLTFSTVIFVLSIPLALWSIWITYVVWVGLFIVLFTTDWLSWQLEARKQETSFPLDQAKQASIHVRHKVGRLRIDSNVAGNILLDGVFGGGLESRIDRSEDAANIQLRDREMPAFLSWQYPWSWGSANVLDWTLHLSNQIPIALEIQTNSGQLAFELGTLQITDLKLNTNTGITRIFLPDREGVTKVDIEANVSELSIHVPPGTAASIHIDNVTARVEVDLARFPMLETQGDYRSANYETAKKQVEIRIEATQSFVNVGLRAQWEDA